MACSTAVAAAITSAAPNAIRFLPRLEAYRAQYGAPLLLLDFQQGIFAQSNIKTESFSGFPGLEYTRASDSALHPDASGDWVSVTSDAPAVYHKNGEAIGHVWSEGFTQYVPNAAASGAVLGALNAGGSLPNAWAKAGSFPIEDIEVLALPVIDGIQCVTLRITPSITYSNAIIRTPSIPIEGFEDGDKLTASWFLALSGGSNVAVGPRITRYEASGSYHSKETDPDLPLTVSLTRFSAEDTLNDSAGSGVIGRVSTDLEIDADAGTPFDLTIGCPNLTRGHVLRAPVANTAASEQIMTGVQTVNTPGLVRLDYAQLSGGFTLILDVEDWRWGGGIEKIFGIDGTGAARLIVFRRDIEGNAVVWMQDDTTTIATGLSVSTVAPTEGRLRFVIAFGPTGFAVSVNGSTADVQTGVDIADAIAGMSAIQFQGEAGTQPPAFVISREVVIVPRVLTPSEVQAESAIS